MERLRDYRYAAVITAALDRIPEAIRPLVAHAHYLTGVDPLYVGLHDYQQTFDGRSYRDTAHVAYVCNQGRLPLDRRHTTVVLPQPVEPRTIVHELGHVLDEVLGFEHIAKPVTAYAENDRYEAFAEAFSAWLCPEYQQWSEVMDALRADRATLALFDGLAA